MLILEEVNENGQGDDIQGNTAEKGTKKITYRRPARDVTLRHLLLNTSGMGAEAGGRVDRVLVLDIVTED